MLRPFLKIYILKNNFKRKSQEERGRERNFNQLSYVSFLLGTEPTT